MNAWHNSRLLNLIASAMFAAATLAVVGSGLWWVSQRPMFDLRRVVVEPAPGDVLRYASSDAIRQAVRRQIGGNFFTVDLETVRNAMQSVPWVRQASVRRVWPDALVVDIEEHRPYGIWGESRLMNTNGELFTANIGQAEEDGPLPVLSGPQGSELAVKRRYEDLRRWLAPLGRTPESVTLSPRYAWSVRLDDDTTLMLGRDQGVPIEERVKRFAAVYARVAEKFDRKADVIDLRYPSGFAVRSVKLLDTDADKTRKPGVSVAKLNR